jgi:hypothetical protein
MTVVVVSMVFTLPGGRPVEFYLTHGRPVLTLDCPMVLLCDEGTRPGLEAIRGDRPTVYIEAPLTSYPLYSTLLPLVRANRRTRPSSDPRNTPEYFLLSILKIVALHTAWSRADVPATHYMWIDLGAAHVVRGLPEALAPILAAPRPKIGCCYIHYRSPQELYPMTRYLAHGGRCGIAGGLLTVEASYVPRLALSVMSVLCDQISQGVGHAEEQVFVYCYDRHPEWFSPYPGDYYSLATNYHRVVEDTECVQTHFVGAALAAGRPDIARIARMRLLVLVISGGQDPVYAKHKEVWRSYMHTIPGVDVYFLEADTPNSPEDTLVCPGIESFEGIIGKTLYAFKALSSHAYTHVLRTNLSSVWNLPRLLDTLETLPRQGLYAGVHGMHEGIPFISGAGILMTPDVCARLLDHEAELLASPYPDDVAIGAVLGPLGPAIPRIDLPTPTTPIRPDGVHYRVKMIYGDSRDHEYDVMRRVVATWMPTEIY